jgi:hypothetical protein
MIKKIHLLIAVTALTLWSCNQDNEQDQISQSLTNTSTKEIHTCTELPLLNNPTAKPNAAIYTSSKWTPGQRIRIKFLNGDSYLQEKVKLYADYWTRFANIKFEYVSISEDADVKIGFKWNNDGASWSALGKQCQYYAQNTPSMNFGWFDANTTDTELNRTILHEFGHLTGLIHEHQSPDGNILWNKPIVYEYYQKNSGWSADKVDANIFNKYSGTQTNYTTYDNLSIMHYPIDASFTTNGYSVGLTTGLSSTDKNFIRKIYPFPIQSNLPNGARLFKDQRITSPNGRFYLTIVYSNLKHKLIIYDDIESKIIWSREPNIKLSNFSSSNVFCELRGGELLLFQGNVSRQMTGDPSLNYVNYATITDNGDIELIKDNIAVWSLFRGKLN